MKSFLRPPTAAAVAKALDEAAAIAGRAPKYLVSDQGPQFREEYRSFCAARTIKPRFGAIGQHGAIAICERFIRTLKDECTRRMLLPLAPAEFQKELIVFANWYGEHRPHRALSGRTPNEVHEGSKPAGDAPRIETRPAMAQRASASTDGGVIPIDAAHLQLVVTSFEGRKHLPVITLERAA